jgi:hypothetical protein
MSISKSHETTLVRRQATVCCKKEPVIKVNAVLSDTKEQGKTPLTAKR